MKKMYAFVVFLILSACGDIPEGFETEIDIITDGGVDLKHNEQALWAFPFPYSTMAFPQDQGPWLGNGAGQTMVANPWVSRWTATDVDYYQTDNEINLVRSVPGNINTCAGGGGPAAVCNSTYYACPATACLTLPTQWQNESTDPWYWGWQTGGSAAPGNHGIWPKYNVQCSGNNPHIQYNPGPNNTITLACMYSMPPFWLHQF